MKKIGVVGYIFKALETSWKKQVIFFCASMFLLVTVYFGSLSLLNRQFEIVEDNYSWVYQVDSMEEQDGQLQITGWAFALNQDAKNKNFKIIFHDTTTGENIYPKMKYLQREDVNNYFQCEFDYGNSGFIAVVSGKKLNDSTYEVILKPVDSRNAFSTNVYYTNGKVEYVHPEEYVRLNVTGTDLEEIVDGGLLRVYRPDIGMYVYQYMGELYWIAEEKYGFVDGDTYVQFQMNTTQFDRLPEDRLINGWNWSNIGFMFCENELVHWNTGEYRVAKYTLPKEYSITQIWTGNYINEWIWMQNFRPWYEFE